MLENTVTNLLRAFSEQHVAPLESQVAQQARVITDIAKAVAAAGEDSELARRLSDLLRRSGFGEKEQGALSAVEKLYSSHVNFDFGTQEVDKDFAMLQRTDLIGWWRYQRFFEPVFKCLSHTKDCSWVTVGDPYGSDAFQMTREGFKSVLPTNIGEYLLKESKARGLIQNYRVENAEALSFPDNSFDYVLCKEAYHHFPRPMVALYEMLRVARKAVVLIEPQDPLIDHPAYVGDWPAGYEASGNYVYTLSRRELHKVALGLDLPAVATRGLYDLWYEGISDVPAREDNPQFVTYRQTVEAEELRCARHEQKYNYILAILYKERPDIDVRQFSGAWSITSFPGNPYITQK